VTTTNSLYVLLLLALLFALAPTYGVTGAAAAALGASIVCTPLYLLQVRRALGISLRVFVRASLRPIVAAIAMAALVRLTLPAWDASVGVAVSAAWLVSGVALGVASYGVIVFLLWFVSGRPPGAEQMVFERARQMLFRRGAVGTP
jgi:peptidoglycan biosynthesis protein MviN/MurJ (putative lipid II flippase)